MSWPRVHDTAWSTALYKAKCSLEYGKLVVWRNCWLRCTACKLLTAGKFRTSGTSRAKPATWRHSVHVRLKLYLFRYSSCLRHVASGKKCTGDCLKSTHCQVGAAAVAELNLSAVKSSRETTERFDREHAQHVHVWRKMRIAQLTVRRRLG